MGYTIIIGEKVLDDSDPEAIRHTVEVVEDVSAPIFHGDNATHNTNVRKPKYSAWEDFLHSVVGLHNLFMNKHDGLMAQHPGIATLTEEHYREINEVYLLINAFSDKKAGFDDKSTFDTERYGTLPTSANVDDYDPHLARLSWLRFWVRWALDNCDNPSLYNG